MTVIFLPEAAREFEDAVIYFESEQPGLGIRFQNEVNVHIQGIIPNPELFRLREGNYRRVNLAVFPYYLAYVLKAETIWILAVAHSYREPKYWIERRTSDGRPNV